MGLGTWESPSGRMREAGKYIEPRCVWGLKCEYVRDASPKSDVQV